MSDLPRKAKSFAVELVEELIGTLLVAALMIGGLVLLWKLGVIRLGGG